VQNINITAFRHWVTDTTLIVHTAIFTLRLLTFSTLLLYFVAFCLQYTLFWWRQLNGWYLFLFSIYTSPTSPLARIHNISLQQYADDTLFYLALSTSDKAGFGFWGGAASNTAVMGRDVNSVCGDCMAGWPQSRRKNSMSFPGFSRAKNLPFHRLLQQKVNVIMTFIKGHSTSTPATLSSQQLFYTNIWMLKILCLLQFFHAVAQNSLSFPRSEKSRSIPGFPGLWPPCVGSGKRMLGTAGMGWGQEKFVGNVAVMGSS